MPPISISTVYLFYSYLHIQYNNNNNILHKFECNTIFGGEAVTDDGDNDDDVEEDDDDGAIMIWFAVDDDDSMKVATTAIPTTILFNPVPNA